MSLLIRDLLNWKQRPQLFAALSVVGLVAVACGSSDSTPLTQTTASAQPTTATSEPTRLLATPTPIPDQTAMPVRDIEPTTESTPISTAPLIISPTLDPDEADFVIDIERLGWKTDWSLRTIPLTELLISLSRAGDRHVLPSLQQLHRVRSKNRRNCPQIWYFRDAAQL